MVVVDELLVEEVVVVDEVVEVVVVGAGVGAGVGSGVAAVHESRATNEARPSRSSLAAILST